MTKCVLKVAKIFAIFNMFDFCYKNFKDITSIINDSTDSSIAFQNRHFRRKNKKFALKSCRFARPRAKILRKFRTNVLKKC